MEGQGIRSARVSGLSSRFCYWDVGRVGEDRASGGLSVPRRTGRPGLFRQVGRLSEAGGMIGGCRFAGG